MSTRLKLCRTPQFRIQGRENLSQRHTKNFVSEMKTKSSQLDIFFFESQHILIWILELKITRVIYISLELYVYIWSYMHLTLRFLQVTWFICKWLELYAYYSINVIIFYHNSWNFLTIHRKILVAESQRCMPEGFNKGIFQNTFFFRTHFFSEHIFWITFNSDCFWQYLLTKCNRTIANGLPTRDALML